MQGFAGKIFAGAVLFFALVSLGSLDNESNYSVASDGGYISPSTGSGFISPSVGPGLATPTIGPGLISPSVGPGFIQPSVGPGLISPPVGPGLISPSSGPGLISPSVGPGFTSPSVGPGFERPQVGEGDVSANVSNGSFVVSNLSRVDANFSLPGNVSVEVLLPKAPVDKKSVGGWRPYSVSNYYKNGESKFVSPPGTVLNLHNDGSWNYGEFSGTWEVANVSDGDWKKWGISGNFKEKLVFHNWPDAAGKVADGPIEETSYGARFLWAVYDAEPPAVDAPAQVWVKFSPAPYAPKEDDAFAEMGLVGKWGLHSRGLVYGGEKQGWESDFATTTILELKKDRSWTFSTSQGKWSVQPISDADWEMWGVRAYGPSKKIVLQGWKNDFEKSKDVASGPIEVSGGQASFFWVIYHLTKNPATGELGMVQRKFRPYQLAAAFLSASVSGSGKITSSDAKINCGNGARQCGAEYESGAQIELEAKADGGWIFSKWTGACSGAGKCSVSMSASKAVAAEFVPGCLGDSDCSSEQKCDNSKCVALECECGIARNHLCQKYECCSDADCGEGKACGVQAHQCVEQSLCREVSAKGDPADKHDLVFVGSAGFKDYEQLEKGVRLLMDFDRPTQPGLGVFSISPFRENKDKFNVWMVLAPDYKHEEQELGLITLEVPVEGDEVRFTRTCQKDTVIVLSSKTFRSWAKMPTQGASGGKVFLSLQNPLAGTEYLGRTLLHELGHAIAGLGDEYVDYAQPDKTQVVEMPNCAPTLEKAMQKWGDLAGTRGVGYYTGVEGIAGTTYYRNPSAPSIPKLGLFPDGHDWGDGGCAYAYKNIRPTATSIMSNHYTFDNDFGPVNERELTSQLAGYSAALDYAWKTRNRQNFGETYAAK